MKLLDEHLEGYIHTPQAMSPETVADVCKQLLRYRRAAAQLTSTTTLDLGITMGEREKYDKFLERDARQKLGIAAAEHAALTWNGNSVRGSLWILKTSNTDSTSSSHVPESRDSKSPFFS